MSYWNKRKHVYILSGILFLSFNLYYLLLMRDRHVVYLLYLDFLLLLLILIFFGIDSYGHRRREREKAELLQRDDIICRVLNVFENRDIAEHDVQMLEEQLRKNFDENCELQDYVAKSCHELKIPLAASLLMNEKIKDAALRRELREQLERMNQQLNTLLLGCKMQSALFDLQIKQVSLQECVKTSIRNNQFFLIQKGIRLDTRVEKENVYTDPAWLVYVLDQLLGNAIKYTKDSPAIRIWAEKTEQGVTLYVEDNGEGIRGCDIRRIFEKGFTGSNQHNGRYKSTGMGLYMTKKIIDRLGHGISVESEYGVYTRFAVAFRENPFYETLHEL